MKNLVKNLVSLLVGCIAAFFIAEIVLRVWNPVETRVKGDEIVLPANKKYIFTDHGIKGLDKRIVHTKNSIGFRGPEMPDHGLEGRLSIISVGGSTTECFYLSDGMTWSDHVYESLKEEFPDIWLNNAGLDGHSTFGHIVLMRDIIAELKPNIVLFLVGNNDIGREDFSEQAHEFIRKGLDFTSPERFLKSASVYSETMMLALNLYRYMRARVQGFTHRHIDITRLQKAENSKMVEIRAIAEHKSNYIDAYRLRLGVLVSTARRNGIDPVFITQPALYGETVDEHTGIDLAGIQVGKYSGRTMWEILELYNNVTRDVGRDEHVYVIDLAAELPKNSEYFYDFIHYTNDGAIQVARIVTVGLSAYLRRVNIGYGTVSSRISETGGM